MGIGVRRGGYGGLQGLPKVVASHCMLSLQPGSWGVCTAGQRVHRLPHGIPFPAMLSMGVWQPCGHPVCCFPLRKYDSLIQAQARELSHLRQTLREGRGASRSLAQHLRDALRSFEELLRGTDIDYYLGQGFREQLAQGRQLAERLSDKLGTSKFFWGCAGAGYYGAWWPGKGCFGGRYEGLWLFKHLVLCGLPASSWAVQLWLCLGTGSLGHGDTDWFLSGLFFQEIDKMWRIKPAMKSWH